MTVCCLAGLTLFTPKKRSAPEILDRPEAYTLAELEQSNADLALVNRYLGSRRALLKHLSAQIGSLPEFSVLDLATGSGDLPVAIAEWARREGRQAAITGIDLNGHTVAMARKRTAGYREIAIREGDMLELGYPDRSFDFVLCSKTAHHLTDLQNVRLLREMRRIARRGYLLLDLRRSWVAYALICLLTRISARNRVTRNDGPLSVLKAFTDQELAALAARAGEPDVRITREPFWLLVLSGELK